MKRKLYILSLLILLLLACSLLTPSASPTPSSGPSPSDETATPAQESTAASTAETPSSQGSEAPTLETCRAWIRENHTLDYDNHGCEEHADILTSVAQIGGGVIPVGENRFFIVWFPRDWESREDREVVLTIHGNGACAENNFKWWQSVAQEHGFAVIALQYAEADVNDLDPREDALFDEVPVVYENLIKAYDAVRTHCPVEGIPVVLHGFSRGSALSYQLALMDKGENGRDLFAAFIADSGGAGPAGSGDQTPGYLKNAPTDAYGGAHFWLYCGMKDYDGVRCDDMEKMQELIVTHGGIVDALYVNPKGGHGLFIGDNVEYRQARDALYAYIDALSQ